MINVTLFESMVGEKDFLEKNYPDHHNIVNVLANDGKIYRYHRYAGDRELLTKIAETPIRFVDKTQLVERRKLVPGGVRVPMKLLYDIENFFKVFMAKHVNPTGGYRAGHGDYEAMALILYNLDTHEFRVSIPAQTVSKASVSYTIDDKADNEIVVVDIHSHNSMGAFFSGVDDRDDRSGAWITGVLGNLDKPEFASVWRFNAGTTKVPLAIGDIFESPQLATSPVDQTWMDKVKVGYVYSGAPYYQRQPGGAQVGNHVGGAQVGNTQFRSEAKSPKIYGAEVGGKSGGLGGFGRSSLGYLNQPGSVFNDDEYENMLEMLVTGGTDLDDDFPFPGDEEVTDNDRNLVRRIEKSFDEFESEQAFSLLLEGMLEKITDEQVLVGIVADAADRITDGTEELTERGIYIIVEPPQVVDAMADMCGQYLTPEQMADAFNEIAEAHNIQFTYAPKE